MRDNIYYHVRDRARQGKSLTGKQAKLLIEERDETLRIGLGFFNTLMKLRAFVDKDAPAYVHADIKAVTDRNDAALASCRQLMAELVRSD